MDGLILLDEARHAGLDVSADGDLLRIRGPRRLERLASQLIQQKAEVLPLLADQTTPAGWPLRIRTWADLPVDWRIEFEERAAIREFHGGQAREHAEAEALKEIMIRMRSAGILAIRE